ncbi:MAG: RNA 2',3'-cyclic phosphodiesterase [Acidobacteria bacterium]|nr:RNA 2',3'-cyclic phosphodiesterase [Acidobacteriota bacterium]MBI3655509.1 RNA 2',3'-cyclic phosphodiesterase [Acidobacteriota bacterium]
MRIFIAVDIPERLKDKLRGLQAEMKQFNAPVRWAAPDGFHITIKFFGEVLDTRQPAICQQLRDIARWSKPFEIHLERLGTFPREQSPRVIWIGTRPEDDRLKNLASTVETAMASIGFAAEEREPSPHITLGRIKGADNLFRLMTYINLYRESQSLGSFVVDNFYLYKSTLAPTGSVYEKLQAFPFGQ